MDAKICFGADHCGYEMKQILKKRIQEKCVISKDFGTHSNESVDYPVFAHLVAVAIENREYDFGILVCGSGQGMAITANKHQEIRAALCWNKSIAALARQHNDANILVLPSRFLTFSQAIEITEVFLMTEFEGGRHKNRIDKISPL